MILRQFCVGLLAVLLCGCEGWSRETIAWESAYQAIHAIDGLQTLEIARHPNCYEEVAGAHWLGSHPSEGDVAVWWGTMAALHAGVTQALVSNDASVGWMRFWQLVTLIQPAYSVGKNWSIGLHVGNVHHEGACVS